MPVRHHILAIVVFWLATTAWLFYRDVLPRQRAGTPPPVSIDLPDEAGKAITWKVRRHDQPVSSAHTGVKYYKEDDTYELNLSMHLREPLGREGLAQLKGIDSSYRITRDGELREIHADITFESNKVEFKPEYHAQVRDGLLRSHWKIVSELGPFELDGIPIEVRKYGSVLNPMQPVSRLRDVREGQRWEMPLFDPLSASLAAAQPSTGGGIRTVQAEVRRPEQPLDWQNRLEPCLVIEYKGDDFNARTWVRERDGLVLQQETVVNGEQLLLVRQPD